MYHLFCDKSKQLLQGKTTTVLQQEPGSLHRNQSHNLLQLHVSIHIHISINKTFDHLLGILKHKFLVICSYNIWRSWSQRHGREREQSEKSLVKPPIFITVLIYKVRNIREKLHGSKRHATKQEVCVFYFACRKKKDSLG